METGTGHLKTLCSARWMHTLGGLVGSGLPLWPLPDLTHQSKLEKAMTPGSNTSFSYTLFCLFVCFVLMSCPILCQKI